MGLGKRLIRNWTRGPVGSSAVTFLALGLPALVIGGHDLFFGTITDDRLTGGAVAAAGSLMLAAACGLLVKKWRWQSGFNITLFAGVVGAGLGLYLLLAQLSYLDGARWPLLVAWAGFVIASVIAIRRRPKPKKGVRFWLRTIATTLSYLGITVPLVINLVQFWWVQSKPISNSAAFGLSVSQQWRDDGQTEDGLFHEFSARVTLKNVTGFEVQILRSTYAFIGNGLTPQPSSDEKFGERLQESRPAGRFDSRYLTYGPRQLLEAGDFLNTPSQLQPAQEFVAEFELALPQDELSKYRFLRFTTNFVVAKGDRLRIETAPLRRAIGACSNVGGSADQCTVTEWRIVSPGWLWTLTKGTQIIETMERLRVKVVDAQQSVAWLDWCVTRDIGQLSAPAKSVCDASRGEPTLERFFGLGYLGPITSDEPIPTTRRP